MPIWPVLTKIMSITRTPSGMVYTEGGSLGKGFVLVQPLRRSAPAPLVGEVAKPSGFDGEVVQRSSCPEAML